MHKDIKTFYDHFKTTGDELNANFKDGNDLSQFQWKLNYLSLLKIKAIGSFQKAYFVPHFNDRLYRNPQICSGCVKFNDCFCCTAMSMDSGRKMMKSLRMTSQQKRSYQYSRRCSNVTNAIEESASTVPKRFKKETLQSE